MTPAVHKAYNDIKIITESFQTILMLIDADGLKKFEQEAETYAGGTMDVILPHFMSIQDMHTSQDNLKTAIKVSRCLRELKSLLIKEEK